MGTFLLAGVLFMGLCICISLLSKWNEIRYRHKGLPPGTMGWPLFGETSEFLKYGPDFMKDHCAKYGNLFKSHILGCPVVCCMDPEINRCILLNEGKGLVPGYPKSTLDILGKTNIAAVQGSTHKYIKGSLVSVVGPSAIKDQLTPKVDKALRSFITDWEGKTIDIQERTNEMTIYLAFNLLFEGESSSTYQSFRSAFAKMLLGTLSLPINIPGTHYYNGLKGRKTVMKILRLMIKERRASSASHNDILDQLMRNDDPRHCLNDEEIMDQIITVMYSGYETVSTTSMMTLKYLHDHPRALQELREEHFAIRQRKKPELPIDWEEYKSMRFTRAVILETSRLASVVNGLLRKTNDDVELNGFIIPRGWRIYVYTRDINYDPFRYPDPLKFNPWRWTENGLESHHYNFIFGGGTRLCPGKELGIFIISTFIHYFATQYSWEEVGREKIKKFPRVEAPNGLHINVYKY